MFNKTTKERLVQWLRFVLGGAINTIITYGFYLAFLMIASYQLAYLLAYVVGIVFSYWFNATFVFRAPLTFKGLFAYPFVYIIQYVFSAIFLGALVEIVGISKSFAPLIVAAGTLPLTFVMSKLVIGWSTRCTVSFKRRR